MQRAIRLDKVRQKPKNKVGQVGQSGKLPPERKTDQLQKAPSSLVARVFPSAKILSSLQSQAYYQPASTFKRTAKMHIYRPFFCDKDPEQAAKALDNSSLINQITTMAILLSGCEFAIYDTANVHLTPQLLPEAKPQLDLRRLNHGTSLVLLHEGAVDWALGSEAAWRWLTMYSLAAQTEASARKLDAFLVESNETVIHRCFTRINMYSAVLKGSKRTQSSPGFPRTTPNDLGGNNIIQQTRRSLMAFWTDPTQREPDWGNAVPPSWMDVRGRMQAQGKTLVDRSNLQA